MFTFLLASIGIMSAMPQEADLILESMREKEIVCLGTHEFVLGILEETAVVFALSGIGKVSAASTATLLISHFGVSEIVFTGVAGGGASVQVGDLVIGSSYLQHDLDLRPVFSQFYVSTLDQQLLFADPALVAKMKLAAEYFLKEETSFPDLGIDKPRIHEGTIVSGDQFIGTLAAHKKICNETKEILPQGFLAIEMEGAAVAQVCQELRVPFVVIRAISDKANSEASVDFMTFMDQVGSHYSAGVLKEYVKL